MFRRQSLSPLPPWVEAALLPRLGAADCGGAARPNRVSAGGHGCLPPSRRRAMWSRLDEAQQIASMVGFLRLSRAAHLARVAPGASVREVLLAGESDQHPGIGSGAAIKSTRGVGGGRSGRRHRTCRHAELEGLVCAGATGHRREPTARRGADRSVHGGRHHRTSRRGELVDGRTCGHGRWLGAVHQGHTASLVIESSHAIGDCRRRPSRARRRWTPRRSVAGPKWILAENCWHELVHAVHSACAAWTATASAT
jgi:hypothetical protein